METRTAFVEAICENPADDAVRLVFADWLDDHGEPERAEFIRVQVELAGLPPDSPRRDQFEPRERALLAEHRTAWLAEVPSFARKDAVFRRGFVEKITTKASQFVKGAKALFKTAPVRGAWLTYRAPWGTTEIPDPALAACEELQRLVSLRVGGYLGSSYIGNQGVQTLVASPHLAKLETLDLSENRITAVAVQALAASPHLANLKSLNLAADLYTDRDRMLGDEGAAALAAAPHLAGLRELNLSHSRIGSKGAEALAKSKHLRNLTRLDLSWNDIGDEGGLALANSATLTNLTTLGLRHTGLGDVAVEDLFTSPHLSRLTDIELYAGELAPEVLGWALATPAGARLTRLALDDSPVEVDAFVRLLEPLRLHSLELHSCGIGPEGAQLLAGFPGLKGLHTLELGYNRLGDDGAVALAESKHLRNLRWLDLSSNDIGVKGITALAGSPNLARLRHLDLHHNKLGNVGAKALMASPHLRLLANLRLHNNRIVKTVYKELREHFGDVITSL
jgi:uncharacterized protein (TIGR02996 family)